MLACLPMRHGEIIRPPDMGLVDKILAAARTHKKQNRFDGPHNVWKAVDEVTGLGQAKDERSRRERNRLIAIVSKKLENEERARDLRDAAAHERELTRGMTPDDLGREDAA